MNKVLRALLAIALAVGLGALFPSASGATTKTKTELTVSAAASLTDVFPVIADAFTKRFPDTVIKFNFASSSTVMNQVIAGAPVDVIATASESTMSTMSTMQSGVDSKLVLRPLFFARNSLTIAVPAGNPANIKSLADLQRGGLLLGVCDTVVPCGASAVELFTKNKLNVTPVTRELDVRSLLGKVISGDLDAGIVYITDVKAAGSKVEFVEIPIKENVMTTYPIAVVSQTENTELSNRFVNFVRFSTTSQAILRAFGFAKPW
jgi:molybdate transport system substrate-binding protein